MGRKKVEKKENFLLFSVVENGQVLKFVILKLKSLLVDMKFFFAMFKLSPEICPLIYTLFVMMFLF